MYMYNYLIQLFTYPQEHNIITAIEKLLKKIFILNMTWYSYFPYAGFKKSSVAFWNSGLSF